MISVDEALKILDEKSTKANPRVITINEANGLVLAEDLFAALDIPAYPQSSMDGFAFDFNSWKKDQPLKLAGEIAAGSNFHEILESGKTIRIFTGAAVPGGADTVVMQEKSKVINGELFIEDENLKAGANVRTQGSEIKKGTLALETGTLLTPAAIGFLAGLGFDKLPVYPKPAISLIVTGNELQMPGQPLQYGQVYEANSFSLEAALKQYGIAEIRKFHCGDNPDALVSLIHDAMEYSDLILLTGGVSVGNYDFTRRAAEQCGVTVLFHKIKQRPGKPVLFGSKGNKLLFGLPGNPASVLTCFYLYVAPAIEKFMNQKPRVKKITAASGSTLKKATGLTWFLKGYFENGTAKSLDAQESYRLSSFARANCLIQIDEDVTECKPNDPVDVYLLP
jgi:molybdopterin molybdotransferase